MRFHTYADNIQLYCNLSNTIANITNINNCTKDSYIWLTNNYLSLNCYKTTTLITNQSNNQYVIPPIIINNNNIPYSTSARNLGVIFDRKHSLTNHISSLTKSRNG